MIKTWLHHQVTEQGVDFQICKGLSWSYTTLPLAVWRDASISSGIKNLLLTWADDASTAVTDSVLRVPFHEIAALDRALAKKLDLPDDVPFVLDLQHKGTIDQPGFSLMIQWLSSTQQQLWGIRRVGCFLQKGAAYFRLSGFLFPFLEAVDKFNNGTIEEGSRLQALAGVMRHLPEQWQKGIKPSGYIERLKIIPAGAFSLDLRTSDGKFTFAPVLYNRPNVEVTTADDDLSHAFDAGLQQPGPALTPEQQRIFAEQRFEQFEDACPFYALGNGAYVVLSDDVRKTLNIVRKVLKKDETEKRNFAKNPRAYLQEEIGETLDEEIIESLFIEYHAGYSERIIDIGLWQRRTLPWTQKEGETWLPEQAGNENESFSVIIAGQEIDLTPKEKTALEEAARAAQQQEQGEFIWNGMVLPVDETIEKIQPLTGKTQTVKKTPEGKTEQQPKFLLIKDNFDAVEYARAVNARERTTHLPDCLPGALKTDLKPHQREGLLWLQQAWRSGLPGVLLADDMGLGKSLQALCFLAWIKQGMARKQPLLLVAPTGLLKNWQAEQDKHLHHPGLGDVVEVYGSNLRRYRIKNDRDIHSGSSSLDVARLREADVLLTTYETLRDYHHSFGSIRFAVAMFDEMQKIKTPSTQLTDAAQVIKADFILGLTGTPVENRLADLWCLFDTMMPSYLGGLKDFSERYEKNPQPDSFVTLKERLSKQQGTIPPVMLRRMKDDVLEGLSKKNIHVCPVPMSSQQANDYEQIVQSARGNTEAGAMMAILQNLSRISLSPFSPFAADSKQLNDSARIKEMFRILDDIAAKQEKALVFIDLKDWQSCLASEIQRRYRLARRPLIINGDKSPLQRQKFVDEFQQAGAGFDVMLLGPKAGGVGLTLTAANHVIHLYRWWNPAIEDQSTDRVHRIGQQKEVHVYYPIAEHPVYGQSSFDWRLNALLEKKRHLSRDILLPPQSTAEDISAIYSQTVMDGMDVSFAQTLANIDRMGGKDFEKWVETQLKNSGFSTSLTPDSHDGKVDVLAYRKDRLCIIIQCKQTTNYQKNCQADVVTELLSARHLHKKPDSLLVGVTNAVSFSKNQCEQARQSGILLFSRADLEIFPSQLLQAPSRNSAI
jgi:SNF2 family DNA or RNA helicase/HJR/Mrr/RecB family endonuclease